MPSQNKRRPNRSCLSDMYQNTTSVKGPAIFQEVISSRVNHLGHKSKERDHLSTSTSCRIPPSHPLSFPSPLQLRSPQKEVVKSLIKRKDLSYPATRHPPPPPPSLFRLDLLPLQSSSNASEIKSGFLNISSSATHPSPGSEPTFSPRSRGHRGVL